MKNRSEDLEELAFEDPPTPILAGLIRTIAILIATIAFIGGALAHREGGYTVQTEILAAIAVFFFILCLLGVAQLMQYLANAAHYGRLTAQIVARRAADERRNQAPTNRPPPTDT